MKRAFVLPSIHSLTLLEALVAAGIECRSARSELGAARMADGYARVAQEVTGLVTSTGLARATPSGDCMRSARSAWAPPA